MTIRKYVLMTTCGLPSGIVMCVMCHAQFSDSFAAILAGKKSAGADRSYVVTSGGRIRHTRCSADASLYAARASSERDENLEESRRCEP